MFIRIQNVNEEGEVYAESEAIADNSSSELMTAMNHALELLAEFPNDLIAIQHFDAPVWSFI